MSKLILAVVAVGAAAMLMRTDVRQSANIFKRNVRHIQHWLKEESAVAAKELENAKPKDIPKEGLAKEMPKEGLAKEMPKEDLPKKD